MEQRSNYTRDTDESTRATAEGALIAEEPPRGAELKQSVLLGTWCQGKNINNSTLWKPGPNLSLTRVKANREVFSHKSCHGKAAANQNLTKTQLALGYLACSTKSLSMQFCRGTGNMSSSSHFSTQTAQGLNKTIEKWLWIVKTHNLCQGSPLHLLALPLLLRHAGLQLANQLVEHLQQFSAQTSEWTHQRNPTVAWLNPFHQNRS